MPTYEYRCNACQREFEYQQKMSDEDLVTCEVCGEDKLEKLISWSTFQMAGMGAKWTDQLHSKQTPQQQREVARAAVDRGVPPKQAELAAAREAKNAAIDAVTGLAAAPSTTASDADPASPEPASEPSTASEDGKQE